MTDLEALTAMVEESTNHRVRSEDAANPRYVRRAERRAHKALSRVVRSYVSTLLGLYDQHSVSKAVTDGVAQAETNAR